MTDLDYINRKIDICFKYMPHEKALKATERLRRMKDLLEAAPDEKK